MVAKEVINAISISPAGNEWLESSSQPRILHVFDRACNLLNERGEVLSVVTPQIGKGPFNVVLEGEVCFSGTLEADSCLSISPAQLTLGELTIRTADAQLWNPRPDWESLHAHRDKIARRCSIAPVAHHELQLPQALLTDLCIAFATANVSSAKTVASQLAGLGIGLTPSGDDVLMGAIYAVWIVHPPDLASLLARETARTAAPLTTTLSAAWLSAAANGGAGILWHTFYDALISDDPVRTRAAVERILVVGETSGADALTGFSNVITSWVETQVPLVDSI